MESLGIEGIRLLAQNGVFAILFLFACALSAYLFLRLQNTQASCLELYKEGEALREQLQEKRISETRETTQMLYNGSQANQKLADGLADVTKSLNAVTQVVTQLCQSKDSNNEYWRHWANNFDGKMADLSRRIEELRNALPGSRR